VSKTPCVIYESNDIHEYVSGVKVIQQFYPAGLCNRIRARLVQNVMDMPYREGNFKYHMLWGLDWVLGSVKVAHLCGNRKTGCTLMIIAVSFRGKGGRWFQNDL
jgi:hypothetical protein